MEKLTIKYKSIEEQKFMENLNKFLNENGLETTKDIEKYIEENPLNIAIFTK